MLFRSPDAPSGTIHVPKASSEPPKAEPDTCQHPHPHHPKAFVSHATQDHPFVEKFAADLRTNGVDAWFSKWEIRPGDSIRAKIDEGLEDCEHFIIVLSKSSINRPWVQSELDAATIRKLDGKVRKIIPIKIEDCGDLPPTLGALLWEDFSNQPYEAALNRVLESIFDVDVRPPLGKPPKRSAPLGTPPPVVVPAMKFPIHSAADERIQLSLTCDTVNLPMPYSGDLWILDTIFLKGLMKSSANPLHPAGFWPEQGVWGTGFRCVLKNYGTGPAFGVTLSLEAVKREIVRGKDPTGWHSGNVLSNHNPIVMVPQPLVQQGQEPFTFYVCSYDPDHLIEITLPTSAFINTDDPSQKATVPLRITSTLGNPLPIMPTRRQDSK